MFFLSLSLLHDGWIRHGAGLCPDLDMNVREVISLLLFFSTKHYLSCSFVEDISAHDVKTKPSRLPELHPILFLISSMNLFLLQSSFQSLNYAADFELRSRAELFQSFVGVGN